MPLKRLLPTNLLMAIGASLTHSLTHCGDIGRSSITSGWNGSCANWDYKLKRGKIEYHIPIGHRISVL
jgi:hypothetical protein